MRKAVVSSLLKSVDYSPALRLLDLEFNSGSVYRYYGVPDFIYDGLMKADSLGRYYNAHIKGQYESREFSITQASTPTAVEAMQLALQALEEQDYGPYTLDDEDHPYYEAAKALRGALRGAGFEPDPVEKIVKEIVRHFDWDRVLVVMRVLDWHWGGGPHSHIPTLPELQEVAAKLLRSVAKDPERQPNGSGGFRVQFDECGRLELQFVVTSYAEGLS